MGLFGKSKKGSSSCCCGNVEDLIINEGQEVNDDVCDCGGGCDCTSMNTAADGALQEEEKSDALCIKILGSGCKNCVTLTDNVHQALKEMNLQAEVVKVTDFAQITSYGIMSTPALVINEKVMSYGKVLKPAEVVKILEKY